MKINLKNSLFLLLASIIWGVAFVAQSQGMDYLGGFTFNCIRNLIGAAVLAPFAIRFSKKEQRQKSKESSLQNAEQIKMAETIQAKVETTGGNRKKILILGGICSGGAMCVASNLQQFGIKYTTVGKAGFITALYIVLVPIFGMFIHKKVGKLVWIGLCFAVGGLYCLCINETLTVGAGDLLVLACAGVFAVQILVIDHFAPKINSVALNCMQLLVCGILSAIPMLMYEKVTWSAIVACAIPLLYAGVLSSGVAYTLQILGQKDMNPTVASMIMSMESVVSVLAGLLILHQRLSTKELIGCVFMFIAVILAQLPEKEKEKNRKKILTEL